MPNIEGEISFGKSSAECVEDAGQLVDGPDPMRLEKIPEEWPVSPVVLTCQVMELRRLTLP